MEGIILIPSILKTRRKTIVVTCMKNEGYIVHDTDYVAYTDYAPG